MILGRHLAVIFVIAAALGWTATADAASGRGLSLKLRSSEARDAPIAEEVDLYSKSHALVIGIDNYAAGWPRLGQAVKDARKIARALEAQGFEVILKTDLDSRSLRQTFEDFFIDKGKDKDARLFVWFAGHGHTDERGEGYLIPTDGVLERDRSRFRRTALSLRRFGEFVRLADSKHVFTIFDSCFAGTIFNVARAAPPPQITRITTRPVRQFLTSGDAGQTVSDDGTFAKLFVEALQGERRADGNRDGYITASEMGAFLDAKMSNYSRNRQTPRYGKLRSPEYDKGDFVFALGTPGPKQSKRAASDDRADYQAYLEQFPRGTFAKLARNKLRALKRKQVAVARPPKAKPKPAAKKAVGVYPKFRPGATFRDCPDCPEMVVIPAGSFRMGDLSGGGDSDEKPVHEVRIGESFAVGKYEVTRGEFTRFVNATGHVVGDACWTYEAGKWKERGGRNWRDPAFSQTDRDPVVCVNWHDAKAYVSWLSRKTGKPYRLLSEAEWEYMARAGSTSRYPFGNSESELCRYGNAADSSTSFKRRNTTCSDGYGEKTAPVGRYKPNRFGVFDVVGNVWEWVEDCWNGTYGGAPTDGRAWESGNCSRRVLRGGSWFDNPGYVRSANRNWYDTTKRSNYSGFRVLRTLSR